MVPIQQEDDISGSRSGFWGAVTWPQQHENAFVPPSWWLKAFLGFQFLHSTVGALCRIIHTDAIVKNFPRIPWDRFFYLLHRCPGVTHHPSGPSGIRSPWRAPGFPGPCPQPSPSASALPGQTPACLVSPPSSWSQTGSPAPPAAQRRSSWCLQLDDKDETQWRETSVIPMSVVVLKCAVLIALNNWSRLFRELMCSLHSL